MQGQPTENQTRSSTHGRPTDVRSGQGGLAAAESPSLPPSGLTAKAEAAAAAAAETGCPCACDCGSRPPPARNRVGMGTKLVADVGCEGRETVSLDEGKHVDSASVSQAASGSLSLNLVSATASACLRQIFACPVPSLCFECRIAWQRCCHRCCDRAAGDARSWAASVVHGAAWAACAARVVGRQAQAEAGGQTLTR